MKRFEDLVRKGCESNKHYISGIKFFPGEAFVSLSCGRGALIKIDDLYDYAKITTKIHGYTRGIVKVKMENLPLYLADEINKEKDKR